MRENSYPYSPDNETLQQEAYSIADDFLVNAIETIDKALGKGAAAGSPALVAAFMRIQAQNFHAGMQARTLDEVGYRLAEVLGRIAENIGEIGEIEQSRLLGESQRK